MTIIDIDETERLRRAAEVRRRLVSKVQRMTGDGVETTIPVPGLSLYKLTAPTAPLSCMSDASLAMIVQGRKRVILGDQAYTYGPSRCLLVAVDLPTIMQVVEASEERPYLGFTLKLDLELARHLIAELDLKTGEWSASGPGIATLAATPELLDAFLRLIELVDMPRDVPALAGAIHREILYRVLVGDQGARLHEIALAGTQANRTAKAIAWLKQNYAQPLRIEDLAAIAGMGVSTFHHRFRAMTAISPLKYQKRLRLHEARRLMLAGLHAGSAALRVGYESQSHFSREYRRLFGEAPLRDIKRLRTVTGAPEPFAARPRPEQARPDRGLPADTESPADEAVGSIPGRGLLTR